jgi:hypothetical protein
MVVAMALVWGLVPQIACFLPDQLLTASEKDCCETMAGQCGQMDMPCCRTVVRTDMTAIQAQVVRSINPALNAVPVAPVTSCALLPRRWTGSFVLDDHAPPPDVGASSLTLRI